METIQQEWECIHKRLLDLEIADRKEEPALLYEAYDLLVMAYQEARELNDEMDEIMKKFIKQEKNLRQKLEKYA